ncbi:nucleotide-sugar transporter-domain-containing protein [Fimicolochytrium jonesii]|uniref:nucleotide-sugar transporter-domain-containing protein n=1 Tax=Fimicolochytrium jonesii TaxID=1396493 RepID=UPI0022FED211|nr:nucleotide-sugar transporter-domain-containing protein [Fimicolochytrium jonesii]KAI8819086.1 nucleotide-sugar transporter-domain-containing protein [Fimicolochytrium jonesii]
MGRMSNGFNTLLLTFIASETIRACLLSNAVRSGCIIPPLDIVFLSELLKFAVSWLMLAVAGPSPPLSRTSPIRKDRATTKVTGWLHHAQDSPHIACAVPALLYFIYNALYMFGLKQTTPSSLHFALVAKIPFTALLHHLLIRRVQKVNAAQRWFALFGIFAGMALFELTGRHDRADDSTDWIVKFFGLVIGLLISLMSGFTSIYTELMLKGNTMSFWQTQFWLYGWGSLFGLIATVAYWWSSEEPISLLGGSSLLPTGSVVIATALTGLLVATILRQQNNLVKLVGNSSATIFIFIAQAAILRDGQALFTPIAVICLTIMSISIFVFNRSLGEHSYELLGEHKGHTPTGWGRSLWSTLYSKTGLRYVGAFVAGSLSLTLLCLTLRESPVQALARTERLRDTPMRDWTAKLVAKYRLNEAWGTCDGMNQTTEIQPIFFPSVWYSNTVPNYLYEFVGSVRANPHINLLLLGADVKGDQCLGLRKLTAEHNNTNIRLICLPPPTMMWLFADGLCSEWKCSESELVTTFETVQALIEIKPYLFVDLKPMMGSVWQRLVNCSSHWAFGDMDIVHGNHADMFPWKALKQFDVMSFSFGDADRVYTRGQYTVVKNDPKVMGFWTRIPEVGNAANFSASYGEMVKQKKVWQLVTDEGSFSHLLVTGDELTWAIMVLFEAPEWSVMKGEPRSQFLITRDLESKYEVMQVNYDAAVYNDSMRAAAELAKVRSAFDKQPTLTDFFGELSEADGHQIYPIELGHLPHDECEAMGWIEPKYRTCFRTLWNHEGRRAQSNPVLMRRPNHTSVEIMWFGPQGREVTLDWDGNVSLGWDPLAIRATRHLFAHFQIWKREPGWAARPLALGETLRITKDAADVPKFEYVPSSNRL